MIFLGQASSYSAGRVFRHLFASGRARDSYALRRVLAERSALPELVSASPSSDALEAAVSRVALYHSGRSALAVAFSALVAPGSPVIIPGLTCIAVVRAVKSAGLTPAYCDISRETLQYDYHKLEVLAKRLTPNQSAKSARSAASGKPAGAAPLDKSEKVCYNGIILVQNTLGQTLDFSRVEKIAKKYNFAIVEDLAHSAGRRYPDGRLAGTAGAAAAYSFGKGKAIDTICGGAVVLREPSLSLLQPLGRPRLSERLRDRWYPLFGAAARLLWPLGLGQPLIATLVRLGWIEKSADTRLDTEVRLTHWQARLALRQLEALPETPLREYRLVRNREKCLRELLRAGFNLSEIWYDAPVAPARYLAEADFPEADCLETVRISSEIINLPTWYPPARLAKAREIIAKYEIEEPK